MECFQRLLSGPNDIEEYSSLSELLLWRIVLLEHGLRVPVHNFNKKWNPLVHMVNPSALVTAKFISCKFIIKPSKTDHPMPFDCFLSTEGFGQGIFLGYYYRSLFYS